MMANSFDPSVQEAINRTWNRDAAAANMDRWLTVCKREGWGQCPANITLLAKVFGASWYFTRFIFFRGLELLKYFDSPRDTDFSRKTLLTWLCRIDEKNDLEQKFDQLRINKNETMFRIFLAYLEGGLSQEQQESALTCLAEATLQCALELLAGTHNADPDISILAMGRMAGGEMNYGSDLDLIFLYAKESGNDQAALIKRIQALLRNIALPTPYGILYEIDMRLRPHGTSGTLISPVQYFTDYHEDKREIWERQMMTRCRPVMDKSGLAGKALDRIIPAIYGRYDEDYLRTEILRMRGKVEQELGKPRGKYEIKRGRGGIMDIDFLTHYLQLLHGHQYPELRTASTRTASRQLGKLGLLPDHRVNGLLMAYDFLKQIEAVLRVMDMKNISAFPSDPETQEVSILARATGFTATDSDDDVTGFLEKYNETTGQVRSCFIEAVGDPAV